MHTFLIAFTPNCSGKIKDSQTMLVIAVTYDV